jgi:hypothetical protein
VHFFVAIGQVCTAGLWQLMNPNAMELDQSEMKISALPSSVDMTDREPNLPF